MSFLTKFFSRAPKAPLPSLEELFRERGLDPGLEGLAPFVPEFEHLEAEGRRHFADAVLELQKRQWPFPPEWTDAQFELLPEVVPTWKAEREGYYHRPIIEGLSERIRVKGVPMPLAWSVLWGVSLEDLMERATDHLRELSKGKPFERHPSGIYVSAFKDGLDASRMLLPELWNNIFPGQNTFIAIPTEDKLLVSPQVLLPKLVDAINQNLAEPKGARIQGIILQYVNQKLLAANLQDPHPIAQPQRELKQGDIIEAYRAQDQDLDSALGVCAPLTLLKTSQGRSVSMALWAEGQPVLLPECDTIGFVGKGGKPLGIYFRQTLPRISEIKGDLVDIWGPRRLRFEGFPTAEQLERLEVFANPEQMAQVFGSQRPAAPKPNAGPAPQSPAQQASAAANNSPVPAHLRGLSLGTQREDK